VLQMNEAALPALEHEFEHTTHRLTSKGALRATLVAIGVLSLTALLVLHSDLTLVSPRLWIAAAIMLVCGVPIVTFAARPERWYPLEPLIAIGYIAGFGMPSFRADFPALHEQDPISEAEYAFACEMILLGCTALVLGMSVPIRQVFARYVWSWPSDDKVVAPRFAIAAVIGGIFHILASTDVVPASIAAPAHLLASMSEVGTVVLFGMWQRGKASPWWCITAFISVLPGLFLGFGSGALWNAMVAPLTLLLGYYGVTRRLPFIPLLITAAAFLPANNAKNEFRGRLNESHVSFIDRPGLFVEVIWDAYTKDEITVESASDHLTARMDHVTEMAQVVSLTPDQVPYWGGETYKTLLYAPIPRFVMPDKPGKRLGQDFGHRYHFIGDENLDTSVNFSQLIETYANFGALGVGIGMFIIGIIYRFVSALFERKDPPVTAIAAGAITALIAFNIESDFSLVNGGLLMTLPTLWATLKLLCWSGRPAGAEH